jgi:carboxyl-terminal processing protease
MTSPARLTIVLCSTIFAALLLGGSLMSRGNTSSGGEGAYKHFGVFSEVLSRIKSDYVEEPDMKNVTMGAITGMLESVDPFASYLNAEQYKQYQALQSRKRGSSGVTLARRAGYPYIAVLNVVPGSPADKAGMMPGDFLETINKIATRDMPLAFAEMSFEGDAGSMLELTALRLSRGSEPMKFSLTRGPVSIPALSAKILEPGVGHIRTLSLAGTRTKELQTAMEDLRRQGAKKLILDLRNCAGGTPEEGVAAAQLLVEKGNITSVSGQRMTKESFEADGRNIWKDTLVVITNRATGGAAEIVAAAVQENNRGKLIGERTYGDAARRRALAMSDGSAVILAVGKFYTPNGKAIQDGGVVPAEAMLDNMLGVDDEGEGPDPEAGTQPAAPAPPPAAKPAEDNLLKRALAIANGK